MVSLNKKWAYVFTLICGSDNVFVAFFDNVNFLTNVFASNSLFFIFYLAVFRKLYEFLSNNGRNEIDIMPGYILAQASSSTALLEASLPETKRPPTMKAASFTNVKYLKNVVWNSKTCS